MGFWAKLKQIFKRTKKEEALQSASKRFDIDLKRSNHRFKALESASNSADYSEKYDEYPDKDVSELTKLSQPEPSTKKLSEPIELQKESLRLGVAAGYTGKAIKEIEASLARIEAQMTSKDWFISNFGGQSTKLIEILTDIKTSLEKHDSNALKRFESIESALNRMVSTAKAAPEPIRKELVAEIESIRASLPLTPKMKRLIAVVKESGRMSYDDLASRLGVSRSSLRGLLSNTMKRTDEIERFSVSGKGWVHYKYPKTTQIPDFP